MEKRKIFLYPAARRDLLAVLFLFTVALTVRLLFLSQAVNSPFFEKLTLDSAYHDELARKIVSGEGLGNRPYFIDPLYIYFLSLLYLLMGRALFWVVFIQLLLGSLNCTLIFLLGRTHLGWKQGILAGLGAALYKPFFFYEATLLKAFLAVFLFDLTVLFLLWGFRELSKGKGGKRLFLLWTLAGFLLGLAALSRGNILLFAPFVLAMILWPGGAPLRRASFSASLFFSLGLCFAIGPVTCRNAIVSHDFVLTTSNAGMNFYMGNNPYNKGGHYQQVPFANPTPGFEEEDFRRYAELQMGRSLKASEVSRFYFSLGFDWIRENPADFLALFFRKFQIFWSFYEIADNYNIYFYERFAPMLRLPFLTFGILAPLGLAGILFSVRDWRRHFLLFLLLFLYSFSVIAFFVIARFRLPVVPILLLFSAEALCRICKEIGERKFQDLALRLLLLFALSLWINWGIWERGRRPRDFFSTFNNLGRIYFEEKEYGKAEKEFLHARDLSPQIPNPYYNLGLIYVIRFKEALKARVPLAEREVFSQKAQENLEKVIRLVPLSSMGYNSRVLLGEVAFLEKDFPRAVEIWEEVSLSRPEPELLRKLGHGYKRLGRLDEAVEAYNRSNSLREDFYTYAALYQVYLKMGDQASAEEASKKARALNPNLAIQEEKKGQ